MQQRSVASFYFTINRSERQEICESVPLEYTRKGQKKIVETSQSVYHISQKQRDIMWHICYSFICLSIIWQIAMKELSTMLDTIILRTEEFLENMPKAIRKKKGQFFTSRETAMFMAGLFDLTSIPQSLEILDPGTGTAILSAALIDRINNEKFEEIIFAFKPSIEGETTSLYIKKILENIDIKITRLASGVPIGADMEYIDSLTLERALNDRKELE